MRSLAVVLALAGCAGPATQTAAPLVVGVAVADITPPDAYPMSGYYHERLSTGIRDRLHAKVLVFRQGKERAALVLCDLCGVAADLTAAVRRYVAAHTDLPPENVVVAATHSHTGPDYYKDLRAHLAGTALSGPRGEYPKQLIDSIGKAIAQADARSVPHRLFVGSATQETEIAFNRRFVMKDGTIRTWANFKNPDTVRAAGPIDPQVQVLLLRDAAGKPVASLTNFALHLDTVGGTKYSADYPFDLEESLRADLGKDFVSIFGNGCCGDINHVNPRADARNKTDFIGQALAVTVKKAISDPWDVAAPSFAVRRAVVPAPLQEATPEDLAWARSIIERDSSGAKIPFLDEVKAYKLVEVENLRKKHGDRLPLEVHAFRLGADTAIVTLPGEVFVELGLAIKKASPFRHTFVIELANAVEPIYIPTREQCPGGGYEVINSTLKPGGGEMLVEAAIGLLRELAR